MNSLVLNPSVATQVPELTPMSAWRCAICPPDVNKTISRQDLKWTEVAEAAAALTGFGRELCWKRLAYAVNGSLRLRWRRARWNKRWEYARGLAYGDFAPGMRVLDFGGGATLPVFYLASQGCEVVSLDIDPKLTLHTNAVAESMGWQLTGSTFDLTDNQPPMDLGTFDRVISFCVVEHLPKDCQLLTLARLAARLKPGGLFALTFDFGGNAPVEGAIRSIQEVMEMIRVTGLTPVGDGEFHDTHERFVIDKKYPDSHFTFGSLFLRKT